MRFNQAVDLYRTVAIETSDPMGLVVMTYEGVIGALGKAELALDEGDYKTKGQEIQRAVSLIGELMSSLDLDKGGVVASSLKALYGYFLKRLLHADVKKDKAALVEVKGQMSQLLEAWRKICRTPPDTQTGS